MAVHPQHRHKGVATLLMEWGMKRMDELHLDSLVEATDMGRRLYENFGYRRVLVLAVDVTKREMSDTWRMLRSQVGLPIAHIYWRPKDGVWKDGEPQAPWEMPVVKS